MKVNVRLFVIVFKSKEMGDILILFLSDFNIYNLNKVINYWEIFDFIKCFIIRWF